MSVVFRKHIKTRFNQLDIEIILLQDPEKVQRDVKLKFSEAVSLSDERLKTYEGMRFLKCSLQAVDSTLQAFTYSE